MTVHSFPRFPAFVLLLIMVLVGLIVDLNLKSLGFTHDSGSTSHRWLNQAYVSLAVKLIHEVQPPASSAAPNLRFGTDRARSEPHLDSAALSRHGFDCRK